MSWVRFGLFDCNLLFSWDLVNALTNFNQIIRKHWNALKMLIRNYVKMFFFFSFHFLWWSQRRNEMHLTRPHQLRLHWNQGPPHTDSPAAGNQPRRGKYCRRAAQTTACEGTAVCCLTKLSRHIRLVCRTTPQDALRNTYILSRIGGDEIDEDDCPVWKWQPGQLADTSADFFFLLVFHVCATLGLK